MGKLNLTNLSAEPDAKIYGWLEKTGALPAADRVISLPDTCPGKSPLPTGTAMVTRDPNWRRFALSDVGCGMSLVRTTLTIDDAYGPVFRQMWDALADELAGRRKGRLGDLGSGNHFIDAAVSHEDGSVCLLVHTGSRMESGLVDDLVDQPATFDAEFGWIRDWAADNRRGVLRTCMAFVGRFKPVADRIDVLDRDHNHFEKQGRTVVIRKGVQRVEPGELAVIPSSLCDDVVLVRATAKVSEIDNCLPHGTGRTMSRSDAKRVAADFDFGELRERVYVPPRISDASLRTESPRCYRKLDDMLAMMNGYVEVVERFTPVAYIGQL